MGWLREPLSILTADNGAVELADSGDSELAADIAGRDPVEYLGEAAGVR